MVCVYCGHETSVINSRLQKRANQVWRRRKCLSCQAVVTTIESVDLSKSLVVSKVGRLEPFSRDYLLLSVYESLKHRKTAQADASELTDTITALAPKENGQIAISDLRDVTFEVLNRFDNAAGTHYQAFHS